MPRVTRFWQERRNGAIATSFSRIEFYQARQAAEAFGLPPSLSNVHLAIEQQVRMNAVVVASHAKIIIKYSYSGINVIVDGKAVVA